MENKFSREEWETCLRVLTALKDNPFENPDNQTFKTLITSIHRQAKKIIKKENHDTRRSADAALLKKTSIINNAQNLTSNFTHTEAEATVLPDLQNSRVCYCCHNRYAQLHFFYHKLCPDCAELNYEHRTRNHDFTSYNVIITGGRVKIGYATVLKFLRSHANVIVTTRFPAQALEQLQAEKDYEQWKDRLTVYGLDLRNLKAVQEFITYCQHSLPALDILINNAAQTIKYPFDYYKPLIAKENKLLAGTAVQNLLPNKTPITYQQDYLLPVGNETEYAVNRFGQPVDYRDKNSWNSTLTEVGMEELLEVNLINHIAPYQIIAGLKDLMAKSNNPQRFIINVTSSEGQFSYPNKTMFHPHTNMTKAALNMMTRTAAQEFMNDSIYMTSVDVGWVSTGAPEGKRAELFNNLRIPPLDPVDGASRIVHPIDEVRNGNTTLYGVLLKDYAVENW